jgi:hypothetical protein
MPDEPVKPREDMLRPLTFWEAAGGFTALMTYVATTAALFFAAVWLVRFAAKALHLGQT